VKQNGGSGHVSDSCCQLSIANSQRPIFISLMFLFTFSALSSAHTLLHQPRKKKLTAQGKKEGSSGSIATTRVYHFRFLFSSHFSFRYLPDELHVTLMILHPSSRRGPFVRVTLASGGFRVYDMQDSAERSVHA
jgi:hypothetical protein